MFFPTCASAFSLILMILYWSLRSPYSMLFWWLQHALPHSMNVCTILERQYFLSGQHCFHLLAIYPMNRCSHPTFVCCWNTIFCCCGIAFCHTLFPKLFCPLLTHWGYHSSPCRCAFLRLAVPTQFPSQIRGVEDELVPWYLSLFIQMFHCIRDGPPSCLDITKCGESSHLCHLRNNDTLLVCFYSSGELAHLCTLVGCTISKNVPSQ